jgi:hypothetical protein
VKRISAGLLIDCYGGEIEGSKKLVLNIMNLREEIDLSKIIKRA